MTTLDTTLTIRLTRQDKQTTKDRAAELGLDVSTDVRHEG